VTVQPKVSIVIPVYNGSDYLREAIDSALAQTYPNVEVVVVNDGSNDAGATEQIALSYGNNIRYFSKENGGVASALNRGVSEMTGAYFSWLSHDDVYYPEKISAQMHALRSMTDRDTILYSDWAVFSGNSGITQEIRLPMVPPESFRYFLTTNNVVHGCSLLIPKRAFDCCGTFNENLRTTQDYDFWYRLAGKFRFVHLPVVLVKGRQHQAQGSVTMREVALLEINALLSGFATNLNFDELLSSGHESACLAYSEIAASFWRRRFYSAARHASRLTLSRVRDDHIQSGVKACLVLFIAVTMTGLRNSARLFVKSVETLVRDVNMVFGSIRYRLLRSRQHDLKQKFSQIYSGNIFGGTESRSGAGSDLKQTLEIRRVLPVLVKELDVRSFMDAPCGDLFWMQATQLGVEKYIGVDIVEALIERDRLEFGSEIREFSCLNLAQDVLPRVDLIFCRDCLVHLNFDDAQRVLRNFKRSGSLYLLTTTFPGREANIDLVGKAIWRTLNLQLAPFNFPKPLRLVNENCTEENGVYSDKSLGLWRLSDIQMG
jgi:glycosyltransferase involved in cell wall biosynthesis